MTCFKNIILLCAILLYSCNSTSFSDHNARVVGGYKSSEISKDYSELILREDSTFKFVEMPSRGDILFEHHGTWTLHENQLCLTSGIDITEHLSIIKKSKIQISDTLKVLQEGLNFTLSSNVSNDYPNDSILHIVKSRYANPDVDSSPIDYEYLSYILMGRSNGFYFQIPYALKYDEIRISMDGTFNSQSNPEVFMKLIFTSDKNLIKMGDDKDTLFSIR